MHPSKFLGVTTDAPAMTDEERGARLGALNSTIADQKKAAISYRRESGIEDVWLACDEAYIGIDDMNRAQFANAKWAKPMNMSAGLQSNISRSDDIRSSAFVRLTGRYVDTSSAKLAEIILPIDDKAFSFKPSPVADAVMQLAPVIAPAMPAPAMPQGAPPGMPQGAPPGMEPQAPSAPADPMIAVQEAATKSAKKAETRIYDWMVESKYPGEARKVIKDAARLGVGVIKGPFPEIRKSKAMVRNGDVMALEIKKSIVPSLKWVDPWMCYPSEGCGENIHDGDWFFELDYLSRRQLKELANEPGYLKDQIKFVLEQGPSKLYTDTKNDKRDSMKSRFEVWYCYGSIPRDDWMAAQPQDAQEELLEDDQDDVYVIITMINDIIVRAIVNPLDSGKLPHQVMCWSRRPGHWAGVGPGEMLQMAQGSVNAATRALFNNAGVSSGVQIVIDQLGIEPADKSWRITPNKIWYKTEAGSGKSVQDSFAVLTIPSLQNDLMSIIQYGMKLAEEATGIPLITQGQTGPTTPDTFAQAQLQNNNALTWLRSVGYSYDDQITEPLVDGFYEWLLLDPSVPEDEKGDFKIDAKGSTAMVERAIQEQFLMSLLQASGNPAFDLDPAKIMEEALKAKRIDPRAVTLSDEDKAKRQQMPPTPAPAIAVAQIRAQADMQKTQAVIGQKDAQADKDRQAEMQIAGMDNQTAQEATRVDTDRDLAYVQSQDRRDMTNANMRMQELQVKERLAMLEYANSQKVSLEQVKSDLARTSMQEQTKREIAAAQVALNKSEGHAGRMAEFAKGPLEPIGRAEDGKAFSQ